MIILPEVPADWLLYEDAEYGFSFRYPRDWELSQDTLGARVIIVAPPQDDFRPRMNVMIRPRDESLFQTTQDDFKAMYEAALQNLEFRSFGVRPFGGNESMHAHFQGTFVGTGQRLEHLQFALLHGDKMFNMMATDIPDNFGKSQAVFDRIFESFRLEGDEAAPPR